MIIKHKLVDGRVVSLRVKPGEYIKDWHDEAGNIVLHGERIVPFDDGLMTHVYSDNDKRIR